MTRVLVVEDEPPLVRALTINLRARGYEVDAAPDGTAALRLAAERRPDVVVLDLGLPDMDGIDVIKALRGWTRVPLVVLSARRTTHEKVDALEAGADDYLTKPFDMAELLARLRAAVRRNAPDGAGGMLPADEPRSLTVATEDFTVDLAAKKARRDGQPVRLTPTEWHLLEILIRSPGRLISQRQLLEEVWGPTFATRTNYLRVYMAQLRRKLEKDPSHPRHLITEPGMGYRFEG
ncbi:response regulator [Streptomyces massasporeus]|uniref:response regulator n=1 Tax=Streptomyces massasporeus TaxID=67324 RepID=UPI0037F17FC9